MAETFYNQIAENKRKSFLLSLIVVALFAALGFSIGVAATGEWSGGIFVMVIALLVGGGLALGSYFGGDALVLKVSGAREVDPTTRAAAHERRPGAGDRGERPDAEGLRHRRHRPERLRDGPRPEARLGRDHDRTPREARSRGAPGRHGPRAVPRPELRHPVRDDRRRPRRVDRPARRLLPPLHVLGRRAVEATGTGTGEAAAGSR